MIGWLPDMTVRSEEPEMMDQMQSDPRALRRTLHLFARVNPILSGYRELIGRYICPDLLRTDGRPMRFLDIGAGACDVDVWLMEWCRRKRRPMEIVCLDHNPRVVRYARRLVRRRSRIEVRMGDARELERMGERFDYVFANHVLHHLSDPEAAEVLRCAERVCDRVLLVNDVRRSYGNYAAFSLISPLLGRGSFAANDGRVSITKGFTVSEFVRLARAADLQGQAAVGVTFPGHVYLVSRKAEG